MGNVSDKGKENPGTTKGGNDAKAEATSPMGGQPQLAEPPKKLDPHKILFGIPLATAAQRSDPGRGLVPSVVRKCTDFLDRRWLKEEGLYRVPGSTARVQQYCELFNQDGNVNQVDFGLEDPSTVASVLKRYLRELPDPIYTAQFHAQFAALEGKSYEVQIQGIRNILPQLPAQNRETLKVLIGHLSRVAENHKANKMTSSNLTIVLCPSLGSVFATMIDHYEQVFAGLPAMEPALTASEEGAPPPPPGPKPSSLVEAAHTRKRTFGGAEDLQAFAGRGASASVQSIASNASSLPPPPPPRPPPRDDLPTPIAEEGTAFSSSVGMRKATLDAWAERDAKPPPPPTESPAPTPPTPSSLPPPPPPEARVSGASTSSARSGLPPPPPPESIYPISEDGLSNSVTSSGTPTFNPPSHAFSLSGSSAGNGPVLSREERRKSIEIVARSGQGGILGSPSSVRKAYEKRGKDQDIAARSRGMTIGAAVRKASAAADQMTASGGAPPPPTTAPPPLPTAGSWDNKIRIRGATVAGGELPPPDRPPPLPVDALSQSDPLHSRHNVIKRASDAAPPSPQNFRMTAMERALNKSS